MADYIDDGTYDFSLGQDAWHEPDRILPNQYAKGVNVTTKGGTLSPRPGLHEQPLKFPDKYITNKYRYQISYRQLFESGKFQAFIPYYDEPDYYMLVVVSGLIFRITARTKEVILLSEDVRLDSNKARINWSYAGDYLVLFDFPSYPVIIDGDTARRADPDEKEVPISELGTFNQNRLFVANGGVEFTAGDPTGNPLTPDAPITFNEIFTPSSPFVNQVFSVPVDETQFPITAMGQIQEVDSSTGIGPLFVATRNSVFFYQANQPRSEWTRTRFGGVLLNNAGIAGPRAFVNVNSDLLFLSGDGMVHTISTARNEVKKWGNVSISREVKNYLKFYDKDLVSLAVCGYFNNRIFISANPYRLQALNVDQEPVTDFAHGGMVVLELENIASMLAQGSPVWAGLWTGVDLLDMGQVNNDFYVIGKDGGRNALYIMDEATTYDSIRGIKRRVKSVIYTKRYTFGDENGEYIQKKQHTLTLHLQDIKGKLDLLIERRPAHSVRWLLYDSWKYYAPYEVCEGIPDCLFGYAGHNFKELIFGDPQEEGCNPVTREDYATFTAQQMRFTIEADYWMLDNLKMRAEVVPMLERPTVVCEKLPSVYQCLQCEPDWTLPELTLCQQ